MSEQESPQPATETQSETPKETRKFAHRRSRKSYAGQCEDILFKISQLTDKESPVKPAVLNALMASLETLRWLEERRDALKRDATLQENTSLKQENERLKQLKQLKPASPLSDDSVSRALAQYEASRNGGQR